VCRKWWDVTGTDMTGQEMLTWGPSMRWVLRLIETGMPSGVAGVDVMEISRPDGASDIADLGLTLSEAKQLLACVWTGGAILDPNDGKTYRLSATYEPNGTLHARIFTGIPLFGKTEILNRVDVRNFTGQC